MIKTWNERCQAHPDHQSGMVSERMIQMRMQEEIDELRAAVFDPDWNRVKALEESLREHMAEIQRLKALAQPEPAAPTVVEPEGLEALVDKCIATYAAHGTSDYMIVDDGKAKDELLSAIRAATPPRAALTVDEAIHALSSALSESKGWLRDYSDAVIRDAIDRREPRAALTEEEIGRVCAPLGFAQLSPVEIARAIEKAHGIGETK